MALDCNVCCETYKGKTRKKIECNHCNYNCCSVCAKKYILEDVNDARCMSCKKNWDREFLIEWFSYSFVDTIYKKHRENILYDRQLSKMEETQVIIEERANMNKIQDKIVEIESSIRELYIKKRELLEEVHDLKYNERKIKDNSPKFFGRCTEDDCKGFINSSWECGICNIKVCKSCKVKLTDLELGDYDLHICNQDVISSLNQIKRECRNCPKCKVSIHRIEGCLQMWCTQCNTAFDWKSGEIIIGIIHNPHFTEWQRNGGGNIDVEVDPCDPNIGYDIQYYTYDKALSNVDKNVSNKFISLVRFVRHLKFNDMGYMQRTINNNTRELELRIRFMTNRIEELEFKKKLQSDDKKIQKQKEILMVYDMYTSVMTGYFIKYIFGGVIPSSRYGDRGSTKLASIKDIKTLDELSDKLIIYTNESMVSISKKFKNTVPIIFTNVVEYVNSDIFETQYYTTNIKY